MGGECFFHIDTVRIHFFGLIFDLFKNGGSLSFVVSSYSSKVDKGKQFSGNKLHGKIKIIVRRSRIAIS